MDENGSKIFDLIQKRIISLYATKLIEALRVPYIGFSREYSLPSTMECKYLQFLFQVAL